MPSQIAAHKQQHILQTPLNIRASSWAFRVNRLPVYKSPLENGAIYIKFLSLTRRQRRTPPSGSSLPNSGADDNSNPEHDRIILRFERSEPCRVFADQNLDDFLIISFADFRIENHETEKFITLMLDTGLSLNGKHYNFFGHSNSQLKSRTCYMYAASKEKIAEEINNMGDFSSMANVAKLSKRIGLMFSSATAVMTLDPSRTADISDVRRNDYIFTDGCGLIAPDFAKELARRSRLVFRDKRYTPSVFQIRYRGYKGVVMVDTRMGEGQDMQILVKFRESMRKFKAGSNHSFSVIGYSKPYAWGRVNDEILLLIHSLGITPETLKQKQQNYFDMLEDALNDHTACFRFLSYRNATALAERLLMEGVEAIRDQVLKLVNEELSAHLNKRNEQRCRIFIEKSRLLYGVCDPYGVLREGQVAVRIEGLTLANAEVLVTRNPCLHPGDCQKFMAVDRRELAHLSDCIIFPINGRRPIADMLSGGDLDGDKFFVTWDKDIMPRTMSVPGSYTAARERVQFGEMGAKQRIEYFANYNNASLGKAKKLYLAWARVKGAASIECVELNHLYSQCVDGARIRIPEHLTSVDVGTMKPDNPNSEIETRFVLDELHDHAVENIHRLQTEIQQNHPKAAMIGLSYDDIYNLLLSMNDASVAYGQTELIKLVLQWCRRNGHPFSEFMEFFDFSEVANQDRLWLFQQLPSTFETRSLIFNGLLQSDVVGIDQLKRFKLHYPGFRWKIFFSASDTIQAGKDRLGAYMDNLKYAMENFHRKFLIIRVDDRLSIGIYIPTIVEPGTETLVQERVRLFAFTSVRDENVPGVMVPSRFNSKLLVDPTRGLFQLYENTIGNTFVYMGRSQRKPLPGVRGREAMRRARESELKEGTASDWVISIALNKFNQPLQRYMGRVNRNGITAAEIYVISNLDRVGLRLLDLWLEQVDSDPSTKIKSFEDEILAYNIPSLEDTNWDEYEQGSLLKDLLVHNYEIALSQTMADASVLEAAFDLLLRCQEYRTLDDMLRMIALSDTHLSDRNLSTLSVLFDRRPSLFISLIRLLDEDDWKGSGTENIERLLSLWPKMLRWAVISTRITGEFVIEPFKKLLLRYRELSFEEFTELVETIILCCPDIELATTLLYMLDEYSARVIVGRPSTIAYFVRNLIGVALDSLEESIEEEKSNRSRRKITVKLKPTTKSYSFTAVIRIDQLVGVPRMGDKVRLIEAGEPTNFGNKPRWSWKASVIDALVVSFQAGKMTFRLLQLPPLHVESCSWMVHCCGPFVTAKTLLDAISSFASEEDAVCAVYSTIMDHTQGGTSSDSVSNLESFHDAQRAIEPYELLNDSQNQAVKTALEKSLTLVWGPPGTGKTTTIAVLLYQYYRRFPGTRILVSAPTHTAVDNILERSVGLFAELGARVIRVSTDVRKVSKAIRKYTCDAFVGKDLSEDSKSRKAALQRIKDSRLVFTTCVGAGIGLLRDISFGVVVVDEASQQTEATCLVPLVKLLEEPGKAVLVGDHVQLQATVHPLANAHGYSLSMFERLFTSEKHRQIERVMLDTQYRMHEDISKFSSREFYDSKLKTGVRREQRILPPSQFPWPVHTMNDHHGIVDFQRVVFVECDAPEDLGRQSKSNNEQVEVCKRACEMLTKVEQDHESTTQVPSMVILTPYSRQLELLKTNAPNIPSSTIDSFQGKEADIVVFSTVRCNQHGNLGFLTDHRRLNVVLTRARLALIIVGSRRTLLGELGQRTVSDLDAENSRQEEQGHALWRRLLKDLPDVVLDDMKDNSK